MTAIAKQPLLRVCAHCQQEGHGPAPGPNQTHGICQRHELRETAEAFAYLSKQYRALNDRLRELVKELILMAIEKEQCLPLPISQTFNRGIAHGYRESARLIGEAQDCGVKHG